MFSMFGLVE
jgi:hypothetical protein